MGKFKDKEGFLFDGTIYHLPMKYRKMGVPRTSNFAAANYYITPRIQIKEDRLKPGLIVTVSVMLKQKWYTAGRIIIPKRHLKAFITVLERYEKQIESGEIKYEG